MIKQGSSIAFEKDAHRHLSKAASLFWTTACALLITGVLLTEFISFLRRDYSSASNFISELGAHGADYALLMNHSSYLPVAVSSTIALLCLADLSTAKPRAKVAFEVWILDSV